MQKTLPQGVWPHGQLGGQIRRVMGNKLEPAKYTGGGHQKVNTQAKWGLFAAIGVKLYSCV